VAVVPESAVGAPPVLTVNLPSSFDSMLGSLAAAEQAIARVASDIKVMVEAQARASADFSRTVEDNKKVMQSLEKAVEDSVRTQRVAFETAGAGGRTISEGAAPRSMAPRNAFEQREQDAYERAQREFQRGQRQPFSTIREDMFGRVAENLSSRQEGFMIDASGQVRTEGGQFVSAADSSRVQGLQQGAEFFQTFAESGAQSAILKQFPQLAGAMKFAGMAGAVVGGAQMAVNQAQEQREAARGYQQALGVSNLEAQRQRASQAMFRTSMMGTMSSTQSNRLFDDVTAMGMVGEERQEATSFAVSAFREFGMDTARSVALVQTASRRGVDSFEELSEALRGVTEAAAQSGLSAEVARNSFVSLYTTMSSTIASSGATAISAGLATAGAQMGRGFQDLGFGGAFNEDHIRRMAAAEGISPNEMLQRLGDPTQAPDVIRSRARRAQENLRSRVGPRAQEALGEIVLGRFQGDVSRISPSDLRNMGQELLHELPDISVLRSVYEHETGFSTDGMDPAQVAGLVFGELLGMGQLDQAAANIESNIASRSITDLELQSELIGEFDAGPTAQEQVTRQLFGDYEGDAFKAGWNPFSKKAREARARQSLRDQYSSTVAGRGGAGADPIIASLIKQSNRGDMFEVNVDGQRRVVDLETLINQFPDKIAEGSVSYATGAKAGRSIADVFGVGARELPQEVRDSIDLQGRIDAGMDWEEHLAAMSREEGVIAGRVYVEPTPELAKYLNFFESGTMEEQAANTSIVPIP